MAVTQADIDALEKVLASGVLQVRYADRTVTYQSTEAMHSELARMKRELATAATGRVARTRYAVAKKGV
jgi:hypothetical protein